MRGRSDGRERAAAQDPAPSGGASLCRGGDRQRGGDVPLLRHQPADVLQAAAATKSWVHVLDHPLHLNDGVRRPLVVAVLEFGHIAAQVLGRHLVVGAVVDALHVGPERLHAVGVGHAVHIRPDEEILCAPGSAPGSSSPHSDTIRDYPARNRPSAAAAGIGEVREGLVGFEGGLGGWLMRPLGDSAGGAV